MIRGVHGEKLVSVLNSDKLPVDEVERIEDAIKVYDDWIIELNEADGDSVTDLIFNMVELLNEYKRFIDLDLIFDSPNDFLHRQKGQLKLDNTVTEEFLPILAKKCIIKEFGSFNADIGAQTQTFSSAHFASSLSNSTIGGGMNIRTKDQDFAMSRRLYIKSSYAPEFNPNDTLNITTNIGYVLAELKTNLDKTMFQEASATAYDVKRAVSGAKYYLLCDYLDMTPISTATTEIDEVLILRKTRRIGSHIRRKFSTYAGRMELRDFYAEYLDSNPYSADIITRFIEHIFSQVIDEELIEESILDVGYF